MSPEREAPPEMAYCSRCRDNAAFQWVEGEGFLSECCFARATPVDVKPPDA